ncbi:hypothetical protein B0H17DRAFT_306287 [Mycena rosella]|uniref:Uncharacterized protein n=1 Tax=Mycena rosella TaxID=1033263 RepID=A0AAD7DUK1_MYCRO|nr:hypothetical protein B0H17DRAFT_306287 [Mycena rosella]
MSKTSRTLSPWCAHGAGPRDELRHLAALRHHTHVVFVDGRLAPQRAAPIMYPAVLRHAADAFRQRVPLADRGRDRLAYRDTFGGRIDRIAHDIKTTDRDLALLLGGEAT